MAEAAVSAFMVIFFIICFEKYYDLRTDNPSAPINRYINLKKHAKKHAGLALYTMFLFGLFVYFMPGGTANTYLKAQYLSRFASEIGGQNAVTAIYLGYRMYDTIFEALMLLVSVTAVLHMSWYKKLDAAQGRGSDIKSSKMSVFAIREISPVILLFGVYLTAHGHISAGGGFHGGVAIASFFICRYLVHDIYDTPIVKYVKVEKFIFAAIISLAAMVIFARALIYVPIGYQPMAQVIYLIIMNTLIAVKVSCGFVILFYRFITIERS